MLTFWAVLKTSIFMHKLILVLFEEPLENLGLLYISAPVYTGCHLGNSLLPLCPFELNVFKLKYPKKDLY